MTDGELIAAYRAGEVSALGELMERHKAAVYGYLLRLTGSRATAEDLFQEVFLKLVRAPGVYNEREKFKAWLFTVARNSAMDNFRRETARREVPLPGTAPRGEEGEAAPADIAAPGGGPEEALEKRLLGERIEAALAGLSEDQREVFYLRHYSELSFKEIAEMLGVPIGTVLARMSRAAARLRGELEKDAEGLQ
jgi:RNA polymerase sigma-70 factor (ECF subfamily)